MVAEVASSKNVKVTPECSPASIFEKAILRKRPAAFNDSNDNSKRHVLSSVIFGKNNPKRFQPEMRQTHQFRFDNSADEMFPSSDYTECTTNVFSVNVESPLTSDLCSYEQGDTPISKTKRFNSGFQLWINKIQYYKRQGPFNRFRRNQGYGDVTAMTSAVEELPEEAYTCYNQFRTQNLTDFFETLMVKQASERSQEVDIPVYAPLNNLTYENLQELREQVFGLPPFSGDSEIDLEQELASTGKILEIVDESENEAEPELMKSEDTNINTSSATGITAVETINALTDTQILADDQEKNDMSASTEAVSPQEALTSQAISSTESQPVESSGSQDVTQTPTPEIIRQLFNDTIHSGDQFELDSTQFKQIDSLSLNEAVLTPIERKMKP